MGFSVHNDVLDAAWDEIRDNCTRVTLCSAQPASFDDANNASGDTPAGYKLLAHTVSNTDFVIADGDVSGRKITRSQLTGATCSASGTATHEAWLDVTGSRLLYVKELTVGKALTASETYTLPSTSCEIEDPVAAA